MGIVALVLLIACTNIANLLLARSTGRARGDRRTAGVGSTAWTHRSATDDGKPDPGACRRCDGRCVCDGRRRAAAANGFKRTEVTPLNVGLNTTVLLFTLGITAMTALLFGTIPAFRATRMELTETLKEGRGMVKGGTKNLLARAMVVLQVALSLVLVVGASLFLRSLINLTSVDTGFNRENVLRMQIDPGSVGYKGDEPRLASLYREIEERVSALPGVHAASFSAFVFHEGSWNGVITVPGMPVSYGADVRHNVISSSYFATMQIPMVAGRTFGPQDTATSQQVAIISERMAKTLFPPGPLVGKSYYVGDINDPPVPVIACEGCEVRQPG